MLVNKTKEEVAISYNQKKIVVEPGKSLDVREFGVPSENVVQVERHILMKNPGVFDQKKTKDILETNKEHLVKIEVLEKEVADRKAEIESLSKGTKNSEDKLNKVLAENDGLKSKNKSLVAEVGDLKAKLKAAL